MKHVLILLVGEKKRPSGFAARSEGKVDERSVVLPLVLGAPLDERRAQVDQLLGQNWLGSQNYCSSRVLMRTVNITHLGAGTGLVVGADQVGGVGQIDEQLLLGVQSRSGKIEQQDLRSDTRG